MLKRALPVLFLLSLWSCRFDDSIPNGVSVIRCETGVCPGELRCDELSQVCVSRRRPIVAASFTPAVVGPSVPGVLTVEPEPGWTVRNVTARRESTVIPLTEVDGEWRFEVRADLSSGEWQVEGDLSPSTGPTEPRVVLTTFEVDTIAPRLVQRSQSIVPLDVDRFGAFVTSANALTRGSALSLELEVSEPIAGEATLTTPGCDVVARSQGQVNLVQRCVLTDDAPEGTLVPQLEVFDPVGNRLVVELPPVVVDVSAPAPADVDSLEGIVYRVGPEGSFYEGDGGLYELVLQPGTVEPGAVVLAWSEQFLLGRQLAPTDGGTLRMRFSLLREPQPPAVEVMDLAGNLSPRLLVRTHERILRATAAIPTNDGYGWGSAQGGRQAVSLTGAWTFQKSFDDSRIRTSFSAVDQTSGTFRFTALDGGGFVRGGSDAYTRSGSAVLVGSSPFFSTASLANGAVLASNGDEVFVVGGLIDGGPAPTFQIRPVSETDCPEICSVFAVERRFLAGPSVKNPGAAFEPRAGRVVLFGGERADGGLSNETWSFDPVDGRWRQLASGGPAARRWATLYAEAETGALLLTGGEPGDANLWRWHDGGWAVAAAVEQPLVSIGHDHASGRSLAVLADGELRWWADGGLRPLPQRPLPLPPFPIRATPEGIVYRSDGAQLRLQRADGGDVVIGPNVIPRDVLLLDAGLESLRLVMQEAQGARLYMVPDAGPLVADSAFTPADVFGDAPDLSGPFSCARSSCRSLVDGASFTIDGGSFAWGARMPDGGWWAHAALPMPARHDVDGRVQRIDRAETRGTRLWLGRLQQWVRLNSGLSTGTFTLDDGRRGTYLTFPSPLSCSTDGTCSGLITDHDGELRGRGSQLSMQSRAGLRFSFSLPPFNPAAWGGRRLWAEVRGVSGASRASGELVGTQWRLGAFGSREQNGEFPCLAAAYDAPGYQQRRVAWPVTSRQLSAEVVACTPERNLGVQSLIAKDVEVVLRYRTAIADDQSLWMP